MDKACHKALKEIFLMYMEGTLHPLISFYLRGRILSLLHKNERDISKRHKSHLSPLPLSFSPSDLHMLHSW